MSADAVAAGKASRAPSIYCADIGSVAKNNFGWAATRADGTEADGTSIEEFARRIGISLNEGEPVALGFECPLSVPVPAEPRLLTAARPGEGSRPWSAGAGAAALATGLTEVVWVLRAVRAQLTREVTSFLHWPDAGLAAGQLFLWEAFVTGEAKLRSHADDARVAVAAFQRALPDPRLHNVVTVADAYSLAGAALLRTGWSRDATILSVAPIVIRA